MVLENINTHEILLYLSTSLKSIFSIISNSSNGLAFSRPSNKDVLILCSSSALSTNDFYFLLLLNTYDH